VASRFEAIEYIPITLKGFGIGDVWKKTIKGRFFYFEFTAAGNHKERQNSGGTSHI